MDFEGYNLPKLHPEVRNYGIVNQSLVEEYPHIYSFPIISDGYCDYLIEAMSDMTADHLENFNEYFDFLTEELSDAILSSMNTMASYLFTKTQFNRLWISHLSEVSAEDQVYDNIDPGYGDYSMIITLEDSCEGGGIAFPKQGVSRWRAVDPYLGCAVLFPSVFEYYINPVSAGTYFSLAVNLELELD